jgi:signal transduction histidine kinase
MSPYDPGKRTQRIERLLEVSRYLGTSLELGALLQSVVDAAGELSDSQASFLLLYEEETDLLKFVAVTLAQKDVLKRNRMPLEKSIAGRVFSQSVPIVIQNTQKEPGFRREVERAIGFEINSILSVPVVFRGEKIGVLEAVNKRNRAHYTGDDVTILETLASQAAVSILSTLMLEETKRAYTELENLERKKSDFVAIASHELRTPLGIIVGHSTVLRETVTEEALREQLDVIVRNANRLVKIVEDLSTVNSFEASASPLPQKQVDIEHLILDMLSTFREMAHKKKVHLAVDIQDRNMIVEGDAEKLNLALTNLVENALNYTDKNGHVLVTAEKLPGYIKVSVIDDGIGIPQESLARIFDKFYQVESHMTRRHGGMGLGLAVAKSMIEMHNGQIWVESVEGKGSNFQFLLPVKEEVKTKPHGVENGILSKPFE